MFNLLNTILLYAFCYDISKVVRCMISLKINIHRILVARILNSHLGEQRGFKWQIVQRSRFRWWRRKPRFQKHDGQCDSRGRRSGRGQILRRSFHLAKIRGGSHRVRQKLHKHMSNVIFVNIFIFSDIIYFSKNWAIYDRNYVSADHRTSDLLIYGC